LAVTRRTPRAPRHGFTLFELLVVMALLILLAAIILPSVGAFRGDTRQRAGADVIRTELATARARAKEEGRPYRVALSQDRTRIRRAPDTIDFAQTQASEISGGSATAVDYPFEHVTAERVFENNASTSASGSDAAEPIDGWVTVATILPDGTCKEDTVLVVIKENEESPVYLRVRGLTCNARIVPNPTTGAGGGAR
jgi:prepilin-type N-terminal cleavage/methylation domain-containing protein